MLLFKGFFLQHKGHLKWTVLFSPLQKPNKRIQRYSKGVKWANQRITHQVTLGLHSDLAPLKSGSVTGTYNKTLTIYVLPNWKSSPFPLKDKREQEGGGGCASEKQPDTGIKESSSKARFAYWRRQTLRGRSQQLLPQTTRRSLCSAFYACHSYIIAAMECWISPLSSS